MKRECDKAVLVIPCFNEASRLPVERLLQDAGLFHAVILVDDCSTDNTAQMLHKTTETLRQNGKKAHVREMEVNSGKGEAVRQGTLYARLNYPERAIAFTDADFSTPLAEMARLAEERARRDIDVLVGARVALAGRKIIRSRLRHWVGRISQTLMSEILDLPIYDTQAGAKIFRGAVAGQLFKDPFVSRWLFDCELLMRARNSGFAIVEEPMQEWREVAGSKVRPSTYIRALSELSKIFFHYRNRASVESKTHRRRT